ncbi:MAG: glycine cleavage system protein GcvH [Anaerolineales bacterium]|nr:glycine cleavage system protein GcvH [Anaerolineales bacterium]
MEFPQDVKYSENDEWIRIEGDVGTIGLTDYAQDQLSDVVYVEVTAEIGETVEKGEVFGLVESVKAAADMYMPVSGTVSEINEDLVDAPELVNSEPYGAAWMVKIGISDPSQIEDLMDASAYEKYVEERSG